jgi:hypothetical protein
VALGFGQGNKLCLTELLTSFFVESGAVIDAWAQAALGTGMSQLDMFKCAAPEVCAWCLKGLGFWISLKRVILHAVGTCQRVWQ